MTTSIKRKLNKVDRQTNIDNYRVTGNKKIQDIRYGPNYVFILGYLDASHI